MGVTIHYRGKIKKKEDADVLAEEIADFAETLGWNFKIWREDWSLPNTASLEGSLDEIRLSGQIPLRGITLYPHKSSEPLSLTFNPDGYLVDGWGMALLAGQKISIEQLWLSTKTQFAPIEIHITIIKLLRYLKKKYIPELAVHDDGGYWIDENANELKQRIGVINRALDQLEDALTADSPNLSGSKSAEEIANRIEEIMRKKFGNF